MRLHEITTQTPEFRRWFGHSRVVDRQGRPLVMYHGTTSDIPAFDRQQIRLNDIDAPFNGFWFSSDPDTMPATSYPTNVIPVYLSIQNPAPWQVWRKVAREVYRDENLRPMSRSFGDEVRHRLEDLGYDGIVYDQRPVIDVEKFNRDGEIPFRDAAGRKHSLKRGKGSRLEPVRTSWEHEVYVIDGKPLMHGDRTRLITDLALMGLIDREADYSGFDKSEGTGTIRVNGKEHTITKQTERGETDDWVWSKPIHDQIDLYSDGVGHVTGYSDIDDFLSSFEHETWVAFRPEQIKSVYNRGTWDPASPHITETIRRPRWTSDSRVLPSRSEITMPMDSRK